MFFNVGKEKRGMHMIAREKIIDMIKETNDERLLKKIYYFVAMLIRPKK